MKFADLLGKADDETLQDLTGAPVVHLLRLLDAELTKPSKLRSLVLEFHPPSDLLRDGSSRELLFDLLSPGDAQELQSHLGLSGANPFQALREAKIAKGSNREASLFSFFGEAIPQEPEREEPESTVDLMPTYGLFSHQRDAVRRVQEMLRVAPYRVLLHMPTGSGKTRTAMNVICDQIRNTEPALVIWLAYSEELCEQAVEEFIKAWEHLGDRELPVHRFWGSHELALDDLRDGFLVSGLAKMYSAAKERTDFITRIADRTSLVIIDEGHQAIAKTYRLVLGILSQKQEGTGLLGLSATPGRTWDDPTVDEELSAFFGRRKVGLKVDGYENPVDYLIEEGYLARPIFEQIMSGSELLTYDLQKVADALDIPLSVLQILEKDEQRNLRIVQKVEELARRHRRILVFAATASHAGLIAAVLRARGLEASAITAETARTVRTRTIRKYRGSNDAPQVICNYGVLTAGFDVPETSAVIIARPTKSLVLFSQMLGRAIRGPRVGGQAEAAVVTVVDPGLPGFGDLAEAFFNWEDVWDVK